MPHLPTPPMNVRIAERLPWPLLKSYAWCKLATDPVYEAVAQRILPTDLPVLDIGSGVGLLGFYLHEQGYRGAYLGVDPDKRKIKAGQKAERRRAKRADARQRGEPNPGIDLRVQEGADPALFTQWIEATAGGHVIMLDVLHYFDGPTQRLLLERMARATAPGGWCLLRLTPRTESWRFTWTRGLERFARGIRWMSRPAQCFPEIETVTAPFEQAGFECHVHPLWGNTPFNGYLFAFHNPA